MARRPDALFSAQPWAEDGGVFLTQAISNSWGSLLIPYAGYLHTFPRLLAMISLIFGYQELPCF